MANRAKENKKMYLADLTLEQRADALIILERCMYDRIFFIEEILGVKDYYQDAFGDDHFISCRDKPQEDWVLIEKGIENWQKQVLDDLDTGETNLAIKSAVGVGKTALVAWVAVHFVSTRDDVKVIATSPSFSQLQDGLIPECRKWVSKLPQWWKSQLEMTDDRIRRKPDGANNFVSFRTARKETPEALQGIHATFVLLLVDEASAVPDVVFEAGQGTMSTPGAITILIGNPTRVSGLFYKAHTKLHKVWTTYSVQSFDSTRVDPTFPDLVAATYGRNSPQYKIRVLAQFPEGNQDSVIPRAWLEAAVDRDILPTSRAVKVWGIDPGRGGDPTGFCERQGKHITDLKELYDEDLMRIVGFSKKRWDSLTAANRPEAIYVDVIGLGAGVVDRLGEMDLPVIPVNVAEMASLSDRFHRLRPELWYKARDFFEARDAVISSKIPAELIEAFIDEMAETQMKTHSSGKNDVESKRDLKARRVASPNLADAFNLTLAEEGAVMNGSFTGRSDQSNWNKPLKYKVGGIA